MTWALPYTMDELAEAIVIEDARVSLGNEGKLVLVNGSIETEEDLLKDPMFDISVHTPVLVREVEMQQWAEFERTEQRKAADGEMEDETVYSYDKIWSSSLIDSNKFRRTTGHENPASMPYENEIFIGNARIGEFYLSEEQMKKIQRKANTLVMDLSEEDAERYNLKINGEYYTDVEDNNAKIGDIRISFLYVDQDTLSEATILAKQSSNTFFEGGTSDNLWFEKKDKEQVITEYRNLNIAALVFLWCFPVFCIFMMVRLILKKRASQEDSIVKPTFRQTPNTGHTAISNNMDSGNSSQNDPGHRPPNDVSTGDDPTSVMVNGNFTDYLIVEDVFTIIGHGCVATGQVGDGSFFVGDRIKILRQNGDIITDEIKRIEMFRRTSNTAHKGDNVGIMMKYITGNDITRGDIIYKEN